MEPRGRRGSRTPGELAAAQGQPTPPFEDPAPAVEPPFAGAPEALPAADDPGAGAGDSPTARAAAGEALDRRPAAPVEPAVPAAADDRAALDRDSLTAFAKAQAALTRGFAMLGVEILRLACAEFDAAAHAASRLIAAGTPSEAARVHADYLQRSLTVALAGAARLSNLNLAITAETAEPLVAQLGRGWVRAPHRAG